MPLPAMSGVRTWSEKVLDGYAARKVDYPMSREIIHPRYFYGRTYCAGIGATACEKRQKARPCIYIREKYQELAFTLF